MAGCGGTRSVGEAAEREVATATSWFAETVKQGKAGMGREAGPQERKGEGRERRAKLTLRASP